MLSWIIYDLHKSHYMARSRQRSDRLQAGKRASSASSLSEQAILCQEQDCSCAWLCKQRWSRTYKRPSAWFSVHESSYAVLQSCRACSFNFIGESHSTYIFWHLPNLLTILSSVASRRRYLWIVCAPKKLYRHSQGALWRIKERNRPLCYFHCTQQICCFGQGQSTNPDTWLNKYGYQIVQDAWTSQRNILCWYW